MNEEISQEQENSSDVEGIQEKRNLRRSFGLFIDSLLAFLRTTLTLRKDIDPQGAIEGIKKDIDFKGHNVWILICSIFIASIGLNVNSIALIIGAMLISPLMGPILGIGLAIGTNDLQTMTRSLKSLGVAVGISILTSALYFALTPLGEVQSEMIARTKPTLLDVLVAIGGGLAGIVAWSRKERNTNVIPGVAIATALMPPLCTAGFGLAKGNFDFFFGASYLFLINSVFISLATLVIIRYLRFPVKEFVNHEREKKVKRYIYFFVILVSIPSAFTFWSAINEGIFKRNAENFISENFVFEDSEVINTKVTFSDEEDVPSSIEIYLLGKPLSDQAERELKSKLPFYSLNEIDLKIHQNKTETNEIAGKIGEQIRTGIIEDLYLKHTEQITEKEEEIGELKSEMQKIKGKQIPFTNLSEEIKLQYKNVEKLAYANTIETQFSKKQDTIPTFFIRWKPITNVEEAKELEKERLAMEKWLRVRLENKKIRVVEY